MRWMAILLLLAGCAQMGPSALHQGRKDYNLAIQRTSEEQLLLNLVRLKYRDTPVFLEISSISTQFGFSTSAQASAALKRLDPHDALGLEGLWGSDERPTISYTLLQGEAFAERLLSPLPLSSLLLLYHSGWSIERVMRLCVQRLNGVKNAPSASGPTPDYAPEFRTFLRIAKLMRILQRRDALTLGYGPEAQPVLWIAPEAKGWPETRELLALLGLDPQQPIYPLSHDLLKRDPNTLSVQTRSLLGILFYLSQGVQVPEEDLEKGRVTLTRDEEGRPFDWRQVTGGILEVEVSQEPPEGASVAVFYRKHWFYIEDRNLDTKSTFTLLAQLFALQAGKVTGTPPLLTLPVGGS